jgi:hypothetical protein
MQPRRIAGAATGLIALLAIAGPARAQTANLATNVSSVVRGGVVVVSYDLVSKDQNAQFSVALEVSSDGGKTYAIRPRTVKGDVGAAVKPGTGKQITWEASRDVENLEVDRYRYRVTATPAAAPPRVASSAANAAQSPAGTTQSGPAASVKPPAKKGKGAMWAGIGLIGAGSALAIMSDSTLKDHECGCRNNGVLWAGLAAAGGGAALLVIGSAKNGNATQVVVRGRGVVVEQQLPIQKLVRTFKP